MRSRTKRGRSAQNDVLDPPSSSSALPKQPWQKVLWKEQHGYADNHTDESFLESLVVSTQPVRDYWKVVRDSAAITQQLSTVALACTVAVFLYQDRISAELLLLCDGAAVAVLGLACLAVGGRLPLKTLRRALRQSTLLVAGVYLLSPLMQTLTRSVSSDSIVATAGYLLLLHLFLHDYNFVNSVTDTLTGSISLGSATFASILLASRMPGQMQVFAQVLVSLQLYLLSPYARRYLRTALPPAYGGLTLVLPATASMMLAPISIVLTSAFVALVIFISLLCPMWLLRIHKFKAKINGPWDEAVPKMSLTLDVTPGSMSLPPRRERDTSDAADVRRTTPCSER